MYECLRKAKRLLRGGAVCLLALALCGSVRIDSLAAAGGDGAASARMLVPVGHTVGIKLFSQGVLVVKCRSGKRLPAPAVCAAAM